MSNTYSPALPLDQRGTPKQEYAPPKVALASTNKENAAVSSVLVFTHDTTEIEVTAVGGPAALKWASITNNGTSVIAAAGSANFDHIVPASVTRRFVVPISTIPASTSSVQGINRSTGLFQGVAYISAGVASSVLTTQY